MGPRWKGKGAEAKALEEPMSITISELQSSLINSDTKGILTEAGVLLEADAQLTELLNRSCFGRQLVTAENEGNNQQWFQLSPEESFFLCYYLKCLKIQGSDHHHRRNESDGEAELLWKHMSSRWPERFPELCKAYCHLRMKNWVVRAGSQFGVDYVAYRHHPALVHSEYAVLVLSDREDDDDANGRMRVWTDFHCTLRLCGGVAKTLLVLYVKRNGAGSARSPAYLEGFTVEERTITRWLPELNRGECLVGPSTSCIRADE